MDFLIVAHYRVKWLRLVPKYSPWYATDRPNYTKIFWFSQIEDVGISSFFGEEWVRMGLKYPVQCSGGSNPIMVHGSCVFLTFDKTNFNFFFCFRHVIIVKLELNKAHHWVNLPVIGEIFCTKSVTEPKAGISVKCNLKISFKCTSHRFAHGEKYLLGFTLLEKQNGQAYVMESTAAGSPLCVLSHMETTEI